LVAYWRLTGAGCYTNQRADIVATQSPAFAVIFSYAQPGRLVTERHGLKHSSRIRIYSFMRFAFLLWFLMLRRARNCHYSYRYCYANQQLAVAITIFAIVEIFDRLNCSVACTFKGFRLTDAFQNCAI